MTNKKDVFNTSSYINNTSKEYSLYVLQNRGIPSVWDGLKDGQRKALFVLQRRAGEIKTISLAGEMISRNIYLHGDSAAADSIGKLAAPYQNNLPLIKGIGNFGTRTCPDAIAAPRYTYVKKNNVTENIIYPDADIVPMMDNYDGSTQSPLHYLPLIPTVLLNGIEGMAPGFSTKILPRDIKDLIQATLDVLNIKMPTTLAPKFAFCSGSVVNEGYNKWAFYGNLQIIDAQTIRITELPPRSSHEKFIEKLIELDDMKAIRSYDDQSKDNTNILVKFPRGFCAGWTVMDALNYFELCYRDTERLVVIDWDGATVNTYGSAEELMISFVQNRFKYYVKRFERMLNDANYELKFWKLLEACYDGDLPGDLASMKNKKELTARIIDIGKNSNIIADNDQIDKIASLPTYRWTQDEYQNIKDKIHEIQSSINQFKALLLDENKIWSIYKKEVKALLSVKFDIER